MQGAGDDDALVLVGGGVLRGHILRIYPEDHVTIALPTGHSARVAWSRIERIESHSPVPAPAPQTTGVWVHIETTRPVIVEGRASSGAWVPQCASPCNVELSLDQAYRIKGRSVRPSGEFTIDAAAGQRVLWQVIPGSRAGYVGGVVLVSVSPVVLAFGLLVDFVGIIISADPLAPVEAVGSLIAVIGAAGLVTGISLIASNRQTSFSQFPALPSQPAALPRPANDAWGPSWWHEASNVERTLPQMQSVPLWTGSF